MDASPIEGLLQVMARLRDPAAGCPWDRQQTFSSIAPYTLEEAYEVADAIERGAIDELKGELGDLLFQVVFHAQMAAEQGHFAFGDVVSGIVEKLVRRHPHVFEGVAAATPETVQGMWETLKAEERARQEGGESAGLLDGVALALPALARAQKLQQRAARAGFDWPEIGGVMKKVEEELDELRAALSAAATPAAIEEEIGDLLFCCVNLARHCQTDAEGALRRANDKFVRRFAYIEERLRAAGLRPTEAGLAEMDRLWEESKAVERGA